MNNDTYENSHFATYDGFTRFMNGDCKYIIGFTEDIRRFDTGRDVSGDKLLDCLDLMEIISNSDFIYDICCVDGKL